MSVLATNSATVPLRKKGKVSEPLPIPKKIFLAIINSLKRRITWIKKKKKKGAWLFKLGFLRDVGWTSFYLFQQKYPKLFNPEAGNLFLKRDR